MQNFLAICLILSLGIVTCNGACICGTAPFCRHPERCELFYQCTGQSQELFKCATGSYFSDYFVCANAADVPCVPNCGGKSRVKDLYNCRQYFECLNNRPVEPVKQCLLGQSFNETLQLCASDRGCPLINNNASCTETFMPSLIPGRYLQKDGRKWIEGTCPSTLRFNMSSCTCVPGSNQTQTVPPCLNVTLPLTSSLSSVGYNYYVKADYASFAGNAVVFNGSTVLTVPALANNEIGDYFRLSISFKIGANQNQEKKALVSNNECSNNGTYSISVGYSTVYALIVLSYNFQETAYNLSGSLGNSNIWNTVTLKKDGTSIQLIINNQVVDNEFGQGKIPNRGCPMIIGKDRGMANFVGSIRDVSARKCM